MWRMLLLLAAVPAWAEPLPQGLTGAALRPGWVTPEGARVTALELTLAPGWKTYWRSPGETGIAPVFDWQGSGAGAQPHWPAPEVFDGGDGSVAFGFHDRLLLPVSLPEAGDGPLRLQVEFGLCETLCVPAALTLEAGAAGTEDAEIVAAMQAGPVPGKVRPSCVAEPIADGVRLLATLPAEGPAPAAAVEIEGAAEGRIWVSAPQVAVADGWLRVTADLVPPAAKPFDFAPGTLRLTLVGLDGATETLGCADRL